MHIQIRLFFVQGNKIKRNCFNKKFANPVFQVVYRNKKKFKSLGV